MKILLLVFFIALFAMGSSYAQQGDPAARLQREIDGLTTALGLSKYEVAKIISIVTEAQKKQSEAFAKMRESINVNRDKMLTERTKMTDETDKLLKAVLTPEHGVKLEAFRKKQAEDRDKRMQQQGQ